MVSMNQSVLKPLGTSASVGDTAYSTDCLTLARAVIEDNPENGPLRLRDLLRVVTHTLTIVAKESALAREVAARSYFHANGYFKVVLFELTDGRKLRLNYWPEARAATRQEHCHNHRWGYASTVLAGDFVHETFRQTPSGLAFDHYVYTPRGERDSFDLHSAGGAFLSQTAASVLMPGDRYVLEFDVIHRFYPRTNRACSLFLQGYPIRDTTDVFVPKGIRLEASHSSPCLTVDELREACRSILELLSMMTRIEASLDTRSLSD